MIWPRYAAEYPDRGHPARRDQDRVESHESQAREPSDPYPAQEIEQGDGDQEKDDVDRPGVRQIQGQGIPGVDDGDEEESHGSRGSESRGDEGQDQHRRQRDQVSGEWRDPARDEIVDQVCDRERRGEEGGYHLDSTYQGGVIVDRPRQGPARSAYAFRFLSFHGASVL